MDETAKLQTVTRYLRRTYGGATPNLNGLKALVEKVASNGALACVTITGDSFEGSSNHGEITLQPLLYLKAALDLLDELDPADPSAEPARGALVDFSTTTVGT